MEKTFSQLSEVFKKFFYYLSFIIILGVAIGINGCSSSEPEDPAVQRAKDSISVYSSIDKAFIEYKSSLDYNDKEKYEKAKSSFEDALKILKKVDSKILKDSNNVQWNKDYNNLAMSITQDYLYSQTNIPEKSLVFGFAKKYNIKYDKINLNAEENTDIESLPDGSDVPLNRNNAVDEYIDFFSKTDRGRSFIDKTLYRSGKYFPLMRKILRFHNTPEEMIYLSVQESGLNPTIVSKAGAVGLWQFMPSTGKAYGLYQDGYRDDRRDIEKSTDAAARHLKDLYRSFGDWYLAWAAYNAGPGRINSAINKSGSTDFWTLRSYLPGETKNYVPSILALSFVFRDPSGYGFKDVEYGKPISFDRVNIKGELSLEKVATYAESDIETIRELNSELTSDVVPNYEVPYQLRVPHGSYSKFIQNYKNSSDYTSNGSVEPEFAGNEASSYYTTEISVTSYAVDGYDPGDQKNLNSVVGKNKIVYNFRGTESLKHVADSFSVRETDIRRWNNLSWNVSPKPNQLINIYLTEKQYKKFYNIKDEIKEEPTNDNGNTNNNNNKNSGDDNIRSDYGKKDNGNKDNSSKDDSNKKEVEKKEKKKPTEKLQTYTVKEGDYLSVIAEKYGVTSADIREWNNIEGDKILVGQKLKIYSDKKVTETKENNKKTTYHIVEEGEYLSTIADNYGVTVSDLKEWNDLEGDKIIVGQKLMVVEPQKTKEKTTEKKSKTKTHKVKEGENLTLIAEKYEVDIDDLREWNDLKKDVIVPGQVLIVSKPSTSKEKKTTTKEEKKKTYKVKKGDTLASISEEFDVSIKDLKNWNDLESDGTIYIGQVLKLYGTEKVTKDKSNKTNNTKEKKVRKRKNE